MQPCPDSDNNLFTVQSKEQTKDRGKCKYDHCSDCEVVLQEKLKGSVSSFVVFCGDLPVLFNERLVVPPQYLAWALFLVPEL